jgi:tetratricopeptide (TPR) repeat protein
VRIAAPSIPIRPKAGDPRHDASSAKRSGGRTDWLRRVGLGCLLGLSACGARPPPLQPLPDIDLSAFEPAVRHAVTTSRSAFDRVAAQRPGDAALGEAYGDLGMTFQAQDLVEPAAIAYANARQLAPGDKRWPYLQGHLFNDAARLPEAVEAFEAALRLAPRDPAILQSLGQVLAQTGNLERARTLFEQLGQDPKSRAAAATGLGKIALTARDYRGAIAYFEEALRLSPTSAKLRQPLATAYQAIGDPARAAEHLRRYSIDGEEPPIEDPVVEVLSAKVAASKVLLRRGQRAAKSGRFDLAEKAFRSAADADPTSAEAVANHGIALANLNRVDEARERLQLALRMDDSIALAHLSLGVLHDRDGDDAAAIEQYQAALRHDPGNVQAAVYLADAQMRHGRPLDAAANYLAARRQNKLEPARIVHSLALAYIKGGQWVEARSALEEGLALQPNSRFFQNALARTLATATDPRVRDAPRALEMAEKLFAAARVPEAAETFAMALAASGRFKKAVELQQEALNTRGADAHSARFVEDNLARYRQNRPASAGWAPDDPAFFPRSPAASRRSA